MRISPFNQQSFKGVLIISRPQGIKDFEIEAKDIIEIDTNASYRTKIQYTDENYELKQQTFPQSEEQKNRTLLAYMAAVNNDVVIRI